jgi:LssY C-terminus
MFVRGLKRILVLHWLLIAFLWCNAGSVFRQQRLVAPGSPAQNNLCGQQGTDSVLNISRSDDWKDTGLALEPGNELQIQVTSTPVANQSACKAAIANNATGSRLRINSAPPTALVAKLAARAQPFPVIESRNISITEAGHLYLALNAAENCGDAISVKIHVAPATATVVKNKLANAAQIWLSGQFGANASSSGSSATASSSTTISSSAPSATKATPLDISSQPIDSQLRKEIDHAPRRVTDQFNNPGDMVNFVIVGSQQQLQTALASANWHLADTSNADAITRAIEMTRQNKDYLQMPMSLLYLFARVQDFGYEQAEPYAVVASRHHFRLWKAPFTYKGELVWLGAGTHDIGFEKDQRNGSVTHKIDPNVDLERENIGESLQKTGLVQALTVYLPSDPVQSAKNATGGGYHSDGRILVITLK